MRYASLFSGIEAASVAWEPIGWEPVAFSEIEPFPCAVLAHRWPDVPNLGDITKIDWGDFKEAHGAVDLVVGGSPCQSFSVAGRREGLDGESCLMWEYVRAVSELRPRWIVWENVPGALSSSGGEDYGCLLRSLDDLGYGLAWRVLDAQFFGVAQRRRRVFLVGSLGSDRAGEVLLEPEGMLGNPPSSREKRKELAALAGRGAEVAGLVWHQGGGAGSIGYSEELSPTIQADKQPAVLGFCPGVSRTGSLTATEELSPTLRTGAGTTLPAVAFACNQRDEVRLQSGDGTLSGAVEARPGKNRTYVMTVTQYGDEVAGTLTARADGSPMPDRGPNVVTDGWVVRRLTPTECERLMGFPDGHTDIPYKGKEHPPDTPRYKALGNSMAVPCMRWIGERIERLEATNEQG